MVWRKNYKTELLRDSVTNECSPVIWIYSKILKKSCFPHVWKTLNKCWLFVSFFFANIQLHISDTNNFQFPFSPLHYSLQRNVFNIKKQFYISLLKNLNLLTVVMCLYLFFFQLFCTRLLLLLLFLFLEIIEFDQWIFEMC